MSVPGEPLGIYVALNVVVEPEQIVTAVGLPLVRLPTETKAEAEVIVPPQVAAVA